MEMENLEKKEISSQEINVTIEIKYKFIFKQIFLEFYTSVTKYKKKLKNNFEWEN